MLKGLKAKLKDQRGLTLIELLAVIVILGIIAAIAVPSIGSLISNTKKDAHIANAQQAANAARLYVTTEQINVTTSGQDIMFSTLQSNGNINSIKDPSSSTGLDYSFDTDPTKGSKVTVIKNGSSIEYRVTLKSNDFTQSYINGTGVVKDASKLTRADVTIP